MKTKKKKNKKKPQPKKGATFKVAQDQIVTLPEIDGVTIHCAFDKLVAVDALIPNPQNPSKHPPMQVEKLAKLIKFHGIRHPITVSNRSGFIISGHCRLLSAIELGLSKFPVDYQDTANEADEWAVLVADNIVQEFAEMDGLKMADGLVMLDGINYDLELTALDPDQIQNFVIGPTSYGDLDKELEDLSGYKDADILLTIPGKFEEKVKKWLADGEQQTATGMGKGVLKRCGLL